MPRWRFTRLLSLQGSARVPKQRCPSSHHRWCSAVAPIPVSRYEVNTSLLRTGMNKGKQVISTPEELAFEAGTALHTGTLREVLREAGEEGTMDEGLLSHLRNGEVPDADAGASISGRKCGADEMLVVLGACAHQRLRDFALFAKLGRQVVPLFAQADPSTVLQILDRYSTLGVLNGPVAVAAARRLVACWREGSSKPSPGDLVSACRICAAQRLRHEELFNTVAGTVKELGTDAFDSSEALILLRCAGALSLEASLADHGVVEALEMKALDKSSGTLTPEAVGALCHAWMLARREGEEMQRINDLLTSVASEIGKRGEDSWAERSGQVLRRRLLLLRSVLRYLHRDSYNALSPEAREALRNVYRLGPLDLSKRDRSFVAKLSVILRKLKIAHFSHALRGPLVLDVLERDRKIVYECNHVDRYYVGTFQKTATARLQERLLKGMGYSVIEIPHWHWQKVRHKKLRLDYVRMSRYYAIKDRRELVSRDEEAQDPAVTQLDHLGEYFFRKDHPRQPWVWFQPQYPERAQKLVADFRAIRVGKAQESATEGIAP